MAAKFSIARIQEQIQPILMSHGIRRAGLFGSAARGEMRRTSDIDILIDTDNKLSLVGIIGLKHQLERTLGRNVDLVEFRAIKPALKKFILRDYVSIV